MGHTFHIPVLGLGYSIDTPLKVARYGISSVVSIVDDDLIERMREYHMQLLGETYIPIKKNDDDSRARRITTYLNFMKRVVDRQLEQLKAQDFDPGSELSYYFSLLPERSRLRQGYDLMMEFPDNYQKKIFQDRLRKEMTSGAIDVNIMSKVDKLNFAKTGEFMGQQNTDALAALRGFAKSDLRSSVILSAGLNPRLYSYIECFDDFFPDENGVTKKRIILKVSDFRSAFIQAKFLAKKGLWVSEFRIESGLNCGGHAFATEGYLLGPILEEFKQKRPAMREDLFINYQSELLKKGILIDAAPKQKLTVQGGIGTAMENEFLLDRYDVDATGWGSPFLLVPEVTNVDNETLKQLEGAGEQDFYLSGASPLGIPFNNFRYSSSEAQRVKRLDAGRPGSPCTKKYLCTNTEFTELPICTASREYQNLKIKQLQTQVLSPVDYTEQLDKITEKICLCEGLCSSTYIKYQIVKPRENKAVAICPGPNLAYFSNTYSLEEMVKHIYGQVDLLDKVKRPHMFLKELNLYVDYLQADITAHLKNLDDKKRKQLVNFKAQLQEGINYYKQLFNCLPNQAADFLQAFYNELIISENKLNGTVI